MSRKQNRGYETPRFTEYGTVESLTNNYDKIGDNTDEYSDGTPLTGSLV